MVTQGIGIEGIVEREAQRLETRAAELRSELDALIDRYPTAAAIAAEIREEAQLDEAFAKLLRNWDWSAERERFKGECSDLMTSAESDSRLVWDWDDDAGIFSHGDTRPLCRPGERSCEIVDVGSLEDRLVAAADAKQAGQKAVSYPIIFSHEAEANHRAVGRSIGWALVAEAIMDGCENDSSLPEISLQGGDKQMAWTSGEGDTFGGLPEAEAFGFIASGESFRRMANFEQTDARAHWLCWMEDREAADRERRVLRDQQGTRLKIEVDRSLSRLRVVESPPSSVVRKRHTVFVDPVDNERRDRYFWKEKSLEEAVEDCVKRWIDEGFRIIYQRLETGDEVRERSA